MATRQEASIRCLLSGLGRATQRGVRRCPKCRTYNGTRGTKCKNKACDHVFASRSPSSAPSPVSSKSDRRDDTVSSPSTAATTTAESIRCITANNSSNIYSCRVRDRGPDYRGFVEVPIIRGLDGTSDPSLNAQFIAETTARCFVEVCGTHKTVLPINTTTGSSGGGGSSGASTHTHHHHSHHQKTGSSSSSSSVSASGGSTNIRLTLIESCAHIKQSVRCATDARPLALKNSVLQKLPITDGMRQQIAELAFDTPGPLVQRVSLTSMVVKCSANQKQPLGYLHCWFAQTSMDRSHGSHHHTPGQPLPMRFSCVCKAFKSFKCANNQLIGNNGVNKTTDPVVDDHKTYELSAERKCVHYYACICAFASDPVLGHEFRHYIVKELPEFVPTEPESQHQFQENKNSVNNTTGDYGTDSCETLTPDSGAESPPFKRLKPEDNGQSDAIHTRKLIDRGIITETDISINFIDWLSSVTELINQSMHYQLNGKPEALVFRIPQGYFDCLQQRIATGLRRKRLPNMTTVFTRKDRPPLGTFTKYTYLITSVTHVQQIFDTTRQSLRLQQYFVQNRDGSYDFAQPSAIGAALADLSDTTTDGSALVGPHSADNLLIKPCELKTFLKVGAVSQEATDSSSTIPFVIEWIPDCLPHSHFGELRVELQFGHMRNGRVERADSV